MHIADKKMKSSPSPQDMSSDMEDAIAKLTEALELKDIAWKRALADYQNLEQRTKTERQQQIRWAASELVEDMLPTLDHMILALEHFTDPSLKMIVDQFTKTLESHGVTRVETLGKSFDPHTMEAVGTEVGKQDVVIREQQAGYYLHDKLLRPARVIVGQGNVTT